MVATSGAEWMTVREAADALGISEAGLRYRLRSGALRSIRVANAIRIPGSEVEAQRVFEKYLEEGALSVEDVADRLNVSTGTVYGLIISGELEATRHGRRWVIPVEKYEGWKDKKIGGDSGT